MHDPKHVVDGLSLAAVGAALAGWLPAAAAAASLVWTLIRIYETKTVQKWIGQAKANRARRVCESEKECRVMFAKEKKDGQE